MTNLWKKVTGITLGAVLALGAGISIAVGSKLNEVKAADVSDTLTASNFAATTTTYTDFTYTSGNNVAYAGQSAKSTAGAIQIRSTYSNSGIVSTSTIGTVKSVTITWNTSTAAGRTLNVYGNTTAYTAASELFGTTNQGTLAGTIVMGTSTTLDLSSGSYTYVGLRSASGAMYIDSIVITYTTAAASDVVTNLAVTPTSGSYNVGDVLPTSTYAVTATVNGVASQTYTNYQAQVGTLTDGTFISRSTVVFGTTTVASGDNLIRFTANDPTTSGGSEYSTADVALTVTAPALTSLTLSPSTTSINVGGSQVITVTPVPAAASASVTWSSAAESIATVSNGTITAVAVGSTVITATSTENTSITATVDVTVVTATSYTLVTDVASLAAGDKVVIAAAGYDYVMSATQNDNNRAQVAATKGTDTITPSAGYAEFTLGAGVTNTSYFTFNDASGYLYAASSSSNYLKSEASVSVNSEWQITITSGVASIVATGSSYTRNIMRYNSQSKLFACYSSGQQDLALYKYVSSDPSAEANTYAVNFLAATETCDVNAASVWADQKTAYEALSSDAKTYLVESIYVADNYASNSNIQKCAQRYDLAVSKQSLENFMGRAALSGVATVEVSNVNNTTTSIAIIVVVGLIGITAIGGYFFFSRKTRKDND